jgi:hypothetical protein
VGRGVRCDGGCDILGIHSMIGDVAVFVCAIEGCWSCEVGHYFY